MGEMSMSADAATPAMWTTMPGQSWLGAWVAFVGMWVAMMAAMMLPSLVPTLWRFRRSIAGSHRERLTALAAAGYFSTWTAIGAIAFPLCAALSATVRAHPELAAIAPIVAGFVVVIAGLVQHSAWKARELARCRAVSAHDHSVSRTARGAWRYGLSLGVHCCQSCAGPTAVMLVLGVMDLRVMAAVGAAITAERLARQGLRMARALGDGAICLGLFLIARAVG
jgi:predicted metal-binding membrane protein